MIKLNGYFAELKSAIEPDTKFKEHAQQADDPVRGHLRSDASFADYYANSFYTARMPATPLSETLKTLI